MRNQLAEHPKKQYSPEQIEKALKAIDIYANNNIKLQDALIEAGINDPYQFYGMKVTSNLVASHFDRAREIKSHVFVEEITDIADTDPDPQAAKVRIQARQWVASKYNRRDYGERTELDVNVKLDLSGILTEARRRAQLIEETDPILIEKSE